MYLDFVHRFNELKAELTDAGRPLHNILQITLVEYAKKGIFNIDTPRAMHYVRLMEVH